jgi:predicted peptidase
MQKTFETKEGYQYLLYLPENYLISGKKWPLILYLHGLSEAGSDLKMLKTRGLPKVLDKGVNVPFVVVSPQCPAGEYWLPETLITLLERVVGEHHIDEDRIYLTGISLGGYGVWRTAIDNPGTFAAIAPICSGGIPEGACLIKDLPAWVLHASEDTGVPVSDAEEMVDALKACGGTVRFTILEGDQASCDQPYGGQELFDWFLTHRKKSLSVA